MMAQVHFGDPPAAGEHEWVRIRAPPLAAPRYRCKRCDRGPFTKTQIETRISRTCYARMSYAPSQHAEETNVQT